MVITAFLFFPALKSGDLTLIYALYFVHGGILHAVAAGTIGTILSEQFPTRVRFTSTAVGYQGASLLAGGLGPLAAAALGAAGGNTVWIGTIMAAACVLSVICLLSLHETHQDGGTASAPSPPTGI